MSKLISDNYREQCEKLHKAQDGWGVASLQYGGILAQIINQLGVDNVLDYGAGKCRLGKALQEAGVVHPVHMTYYDPGIPEISDSPQPHDMVACIDVLEHIEPECIDAVLDDLKRVTKQFGFFTVACTPAMKTLPDGRNAHILQRPPHWWLRDLSTRFEIAKFNGSYEHFMVFVKAL